VGRFGDVLWRATVLGALERASSISVMKLGEPFSYAQQIVHKRRFHAFESIAMRAIRERSASSLGEVA
jgi:hypothetical protein